MKTYTIKLGARIPACGVVQVDAANAQEALTKLLTERPSYSEVEWDVDWCFPSEQIVVDAIESEDGGEVYEDLEIPGDASEGAATIALTLAVASINTAEGSAIAEEGNEQEDDDEDEPEDDDEDGVIGSGRHTFKLKYECYRQEAAWVVVKADSLEQALETSKKIDAKYLEWSQEDEWTHPRLYGVEDEEGEMIAEVDLDHVSGVFTWFSEDLAHQRSSAATFPARKLRAEQFAESEWEAARAKGFDV